MSAATYQITDIEQGADWSMILNIQAIDGSVVNLSSCSLKMQVRSGSVDSNVTILANLTTSNGGITFLSALNGQIKISLTASQTANIPASNYYYDLFITDSSSRVTRALEGGLLVQPRYTA
jgi:hypothetical protein